MRGFARLPIAYTGDVLKALASAVRFWRLGSAGHRLRPWRSEYLRWRVETFTGKPAATLMFKDFAQLAWQERHQIRRFLLWAGELNEQASGKKR